MRKFLVYLIIATSLFLSSFAGAASGRSQTNDFNLYLAAGQNYTFPSSVRLGWGAWEAGLLSPGFYGFNKMFPVSNSSLYASFGFGVNGDGDPTNIGFQAGAGVNYDIIFGLGVRAEMFALANMNGKFNSHGLLGLSYVF